MKSRSYMGFGIAVIIALIAVTAFMADQTGTTNAAGAGPAMSLSVPGGDCDGTTCTVAPGAAFTLEIEIDAAPADGYISSNSWIDFGSDLVYNPTDDSSGSDELVWDDNGCTVAVRFQVVVTAVNHGCLTGIIPPLPVSNFVGTYLSLSFNCSEADSSTEVRIIPELEDPAGTSGAHFVVPDLGADHVLPKLTGLTITCGAGGGDTPVPTTPPVATTPPAATDTPQPTDTPVPPDELCGDLNKDGSVDSRDALWVLWFVAGLVSELDNDGDVNGDGSVTAVDASLILQAEAGLVETPCV